MARQTPPLHDEDEQSIARQTDKQIKSFVITVIEVFFTYIHRNFRYVLLNRDIVSIDFHWFHIDQNKCHYLNMDFVDYMDFLSNKFITISKNFSFLIFFTILTFRSDVFRCTHTNSISTRASILTLTSTLINFPSN